MRRHVLVAFIGLVVGLGTGVVGMSVLAPEAGAQMGPVYEYRCVNTHARWTDGEVHDIFNAAGASGWELVTMTSDKDYDYQACFKRRNR